VSFRRVATFCAIAIIYLALPNIYPRFMSPNDLLHSLQFHQQTITNNQIRPKYPNNNPTKTNRNRHLNIHAQTSLRQTTRIASR